MAVYKPTMCSPFLKGVDARVGFRIKPADQKLASAPVQYLTCKIDTSNKDITGYKIKIYNERNTQIFPPEEYDYISPIEEIQVSEWGYVEHDVNSGINGTNLQIPFFRNKWLYNQWNPEKSRYSYRSWNSMYFMSDYIVDHVILPAGKSSAPASLISRGLEKPELVSSWELIPDTATAYQGCLRYTQWESLDAMYSNYLELDDEPIMNGDLILITGSSSKAGIWKATNAELDVDYIEGAEEVKTDTITQIILEPFIVPLSDQVKVSLSKGTSFHDMVWKSDGGNVSFYKDHSEWGYGKWDSSTNQFEKILDFQCSEGLYKWEVTLYQGDCVLETKEGDKSYGAIALYDDISDNNFDMTLSSGKIMGTTQDRIQLGGIFNRNFAEGIVPQGTDADPLVLQGTYMELSNLENPGKILAGSTNRVYIESYDATYGHAYPISDSLDSYQALNAKSCQFFEHSNNPEDILDTDIVNYAFSKNVDLSFFLLDQEKGWQYIENEQDWLDGDETTLKRRIVIQNTDSFTFPSIIEDGNYILLYGQDQAKQNGVYIVSTSISGDDDTNDRESYKVIKRAPSYGEWSDYIGKVIYSINGDIESARNIECLAGNGTGGNTLWNPNEDITPGSSNLYFTPEKPILLFKNKLGTNGTFNLFDQENECPEPGERQSGITTIDGISIQAGDMIVYKDGKYGMVKEVSEKGYTLSSDVEIQRLNDGQYFYITSGKELAKQTFQMFKYVDAFYPPPGTISSKIGNTVGGATVFAGMVILFSGDGRYGTVAGSSSSGWYIDSSTIGTIADFDCFYIGGGTYRGRSIKRGVNYKDCFDYYDAGTTGATDGSFLKTDGVTLIGNSKVSLNNLKKGTKILYNNGVFNTVGYLTQPKDQSSPTGGYRLYGGTSYGSYGQIEAGEQYYVKKSGSLCLVKMSDTGRVSNAGLSPSTFKWEANFDLYTATVLHNTVDRTFISPWDGLQKGMKLCLLNDKRIYTWKNYEKYESSQNPEVVYQTKWIKVEDFNDKLFYIDHPMILNESLADSPLSPFKDDDAGEPWKYDIRYFFRASDQNPIYSYIPPHVVLMQDETKYSDLSFVGRWGQYVVKEEDSTSSEGYKNAIYCAKDDDGNNAQYVVHQFSRFGMLNRRYAHLGAEYVQYGSSSWESFQWLLYSGEHDLSEGELPDDEYLLQDTGKVYNGKIEVDFYGLTNDGQANAHYTVVLVIEDSLGDTLYYVMGLQTIPGARASYLDEISEESSDTTEMFTATLDREYQAIVLSISDSYTEENRPKYSIYRREYDVYVNPAVKKEGYYCEPYSVVIRDLPTSGSSNTEDKLLDYGAWGKFFQDEEFTIEIDEKSTDYLYRDKKTGWIYRYIPAEERAKDSNLFEFMLSDTEYYRQYVGEWKPVLINSNLTTFRDYNITSGRSYQYIIYPANNLLGKYEWDPLEVPQQTFANYLGKIFIGTQGIDFNTTHEILMSGNKYTSTYSGAPVKTCWESWSISELIPETLEKTLPIVKKKYRVNTDNVWTFKYSLDTGAQTQEFSKQEFQTLGQYPQIFTGELNTESGTVSALLGSELTPLSKYRYIERRKESRINPLSTNEKAAMLRQWNAFCFSKNPKLLKDIKGQSWIVQIIANSSTPQNFVHDVPDTIQFSWKQIDSSENVIIYGEYQEQDRQIAKEKGSPVWESIF